MNITSSLTDEDGIQRDDNSAFLNIASNYFRSLISSNGSHGMEKVLNGILPCITTEMNDNLCREFIFEEVCAAVKSMSPLKASWEDGLGAIFYQCFWHVVGGDVADYYIKTLAANYDLSEINSTWIVLIPKVSNSLHMNQFRPISLCNILYKIISKMLVNRLQSVIHCCIDEAQSVFVLEDSFSIIFWRLMNRYTF